MLAPGCEDKQGPSKSSSEHARISYDTSCNSAFFLSLIAYLRLTSTMVVMAIFFLQELEQLNHVRPEIHQIRTLALTPRPEAARYEYRIAHLCDS